VSNCVFCQWTQTVVVVVVDDVEILEPSFIKYALKTVKFQKFVPPQALTTHKGSIFLVPFIVNLSTIGSWVISSTLQPFSPRYPLTRHLRVYQRWFRPFGEENFCPCWELTTGQSSAQPNHYIDWTIPPHDLRAVYRPRVSKKLLSRIFGFEGEVVTSRRNVLCT
jgi:hypothetical protein